jgi:hypothetical protein
VPLKLLTHLALTSSALLRADEDAEEAARVQAALAAGQAPPATLRQRSWARGLLLRAMRGDAAVADPAAWLRRTLRGVVAQEQLAVLLTHFDALPATAVGEMVEPSDYHPQASQGWTEHWVALHGARGRGLLPRAGRSKGEKCVPDRPCGASYQGHYIM